MYQHNLRMFYLLGYQFGSRIVDVVGTRFWRIGTTGDSGIFNDIASNRINMLLITEHRDDLLRLAGSLNLDVVLAAGLTRLAL
ncbi:Tn3 family transposase [Brucella pituitosa]|uniref:Tn3 family transposase n=1 Tax=Brucella pituitosa TaxID=571256 RepID=UPI0024943B3B|nr:Tn3 family transposase [Brucella pituitosa]